MSILVIDDEADARALLTSILEAEGFPVRTADSGDLALASLTVRRPELILVDVRMPVMDGFEFCRRVKASEETRDIPVIFLSASCDTRDRVKGFRIGGVDFIPKPFQREELLARVRTHLDLSRLRAQLQRRVSQQTGKLRESEERFRTIADAAPVMIWTSGPDRLCDFVNQRWLDFTGRSPDDERGDGWSDSVHPEDLERCWSTYTSAFDARRAFEMEYRLRRVDGEYRWLLDRGTPRFSPDGTFAGYVGSCVDISDLKQANQRLLAAQKFESLGLMAAGVAHDFGNLLGAVIAEADAALGEMTADVPVHGSLERIAAVAARGVEIVQMLMASAGAGNRAATFTGVNLSSEVDNLLRLLRPTLSKRAAIKVHLADGVAQVFGNPAQIQQVILNLVTNASDALGDRPGAITISTNETRLDAGDDLLGLPGGHYVRLRVVDTGSGISADARARIFDPFFTTKPDGRGLGLAAVHGIVRSHGGAISVQSAPGAGATFEVWLPCVDAATRFAGGHC